MVNVHWMPTRRNDKVTQYEMLKRMPLLDLAYEVVEKRALVHYEALHSRINEIGGTAWIAMGSDGRRTVREALEINLSS